MTRPTRVASVLILIHLTVPLPQAGAVTPPPVDRVYLPREASPSPPGPTEQSQRCAVNPVTKSASQKQLSPLNLAASWPLSRGAGQTVAVIDTGVTRHRLLPRLTAAGDYVSSGDGTQDCDGHGTAVAGIIGAAPYNGFGGVAPDSTIMAIRQSSNKFRLTAEVTTSGLGDVDSLARAVRTAADAGATVINISSVACQPSDEPLDDRALGAALAYAVDVRNVVVVSAAGNVGGGCNTQNPLSTAVPDWDSVASVVSPAWYDDYVLTVGSISADGAASDFSLAGPWVDVAAPGEQVVSLAVGGDDLTDTRPDDPQRRPLSGTSYAAPVVSGVVALLRSRSPHLSARQVMARIKDTARHPAGGWNPRVGHGVVDALAALSADGDGVAPEPPIPSLLDPAPHQGAADRLPHRIALIGTVFCVIVALAAGALRLRMRP